VSNCSTAKQRSQLAAQPTCPAGFSKERKPQSGASGCSKNAQHCASQHYSEHYNTFWPYEMLLAVLSHCPRTIVVWCMPSEHQPRKHRELPLLYIEQLTRGEIAVNTKCLQLLKKFLDTFSQLLPIKCSDGVSKILLWPV